MYATLDVVDPFMAAVAVRYPVRPRLEEWVLPEGTVPESVLHDAVAERLKLLLSAWAQHVERPVWVARNLAIRWLEKTPSIGIDPDVCVLDPPPDGIEDLGSLCLWKPGHKAPPLCIEVVSANHPHKDYAAIQDRYAAMGTRELVVFDPLLAGPSSLGGPVALQLWRHDDVGLFERVHFGSSPVFSETLDAWFLPEGRVLAIANDKHGAQPWLTKEEQERAEKERERAARLELERRLVALEAAAKNNQR